MKIFVQFKFCTTNTLRRDGTACNLNIHDLKPNPAEGKLFMEAIQGLAIFPARQETLKKSATHTVWLEAHLPYFLKYFNLSCNISCNFPCNISCRPWGKRDLQCDRTPSWYWLFPGHWVHTVYSPYSSTKLFVNLFSNILGKILQPSFVLKFKISLTLTLTFSQPSLQT